MGRRAAGAAVGWMTGGRRTVGRRTRRRGGGEAASEPERKPTPQGCPTHAPHLCPLLLGAWEAGEGAVCEEARGWSWLRTEPGLPAAWCAVRWRQRESVPRARPQSRAAAERGSTAAGDRSLPLVRIPAVNACSPPAGCLDQLQQPADDVHSWCTEKAYSASASAAVWLCGHAVRSGKGPAQCGS